MDKVLLSSRSDDHGTPESILRLVRDVLIDIDLDPCASGTLKSIGAKKAYKEADDGLLLPWEGRTFSNWPYGRSIGKWVDKLNYELREGRCTESIALVPARVDTAWWRRLVVDCGAVCFVSGRLTFVGNKDPAPFPSALVYHGESWFRFADVMREVGSIWTRAG